MEEHQIGWIAAIIIGGIAGWLAEQFMKSQMGPAALALATTNIPRSRESAAGTNHRSRQPDYAVYSVAVSLSLAARET